MQNGKLLPSHRNVVILSIKPKRPNYPANQKLVPVKEALKEWDKLDAYYRGQLLQLNDKTPKKSIKKKKEKSGANNKQYAPEDLFGDENSFYGNDEQIKAEKDDYESDLDNYYDHYDDKKYNKTESKGVKFSSSERDNNLENYLAISKEDFTIRLDANNKKRCWQKGKNQKMLRPVLTSNYRPPVAAGFNSIHIQKILYHKCTTESPERFSSGTTGSSKDSLKDHDKEKPTIKQNVPKLKDSNSTVSNTKVAAVPQPSITIKNKNNTKELLSNTQQSNPSINNNNTSTKNKNLEKKYKSCDNENSSDQQKRKSDPAERQKSKRKMDSESPVPVSSTSELFEKTSPVNKKQKYSSSSSLDEREQSCEFSENGLRQFSPNETPGESETPKATESLVNTIVNQSRKSFQSVNKKDSDIRERQRILESKRRKCYALKKGQEQEELESIELAFKTFELILDFPPLSPIRSPPMSRWSQQQC